MSTRKQTEEKVFTYIREHHMLSPGDKVVAGISGGADSVCLLFVLLEWAKINALELAVVHVNHGVRKEAGEDAAYVEELCRKQNIPFYVIQEDVPARAAAEKLSEEEMGRRVRYKAFAKVMEELHANKIAVAHNSNDRSETMLFHLFRGSGIKGLSSIQPVRGEIIRPILCLERSEIEEYLLERGISYCQDATNSLDDYTRNRIRHHILPFVEEQIVRGCVQHMAQTAEMLSETEDYLMQQTEEVMRLCVEPVLVSMAEETNRGRIMGYQMKIPDFQNQHPILQKRILHTILKSLTPHQKDISYIHIQDVLELFARPGNRMICLPFGIRARREYEKIVIQVMEGEENYHSSMRMVGSAEVLQEPTAGSVSEITGKLQRQTTTNTCNQQAFRLPSPFTPGWAHTIPLGDGKQLVFSILKVEGQLENICKKMEEVPSNQCTKWFDCDKIKGCITLRTRKIGDYLTISRGEGQVGHKSVKDYMIAQKIPREQRDILPLLAEDDHVLWLLGYRISEYYKITENTKYVLQVQLIGKEVPAKRTEEKNGRTNHSTQNGRRSECQNQGNRGTNQ